MTYCRICGQGTAAYVCYRCMRVWGVLYGRAVVLDRLMEDEVARLSVKAPAGGGAGGSEAPEAVALGALEARGDLRDGMRYLRRQVGAGESNLLERLPTIQEHPEDEAALHGDFTALLVAVETCTSMVDNREKLQTIGVCSCGAEVAARASAGVAKCRKCGCVDRVSVLAARRRAAARARVAGYRLTYTNAVAYLQTAFPTHSPNTIRSWVRRNLKGVKDSEGLYPVAALEEFVALREEGMRRAA